MLQKHKFLTKTQVNPLFRRHPSKWGSIKPEDLFGSKAKHYLEIV